MSDPHVLTIRDETVFGEIIHEMNLSFLMGKISVKDIITERVKHEVDAYNDKVEMKHYGLVQPKEAELLLNKFILKKRAKVSAKKQVAIALKAFDENGFFLLVDDEQVEDLAHLIDLTKSKSISFIKLTPLVGG